jgi:HK97 family phage major capsid protein
MPYNNLIDRADAGALIPQEVSNEIIRNVPTRSSVMQLARRLPNMSRNQRRLPVMSALATAYFVTGDTGVKQTSEVTWGNKYIDAEELAVIVPIPEAVLDDADFDIWGEVRPQLEEAFGLAIDQAVIHGTNIPATWVTNLGTHNGLLDGCADAAQTVDLSVQIAAGKDLYDVILGDGGVISLVEANGFMVSGHVAHMSMRGKLRGLRYKVWDGEAANPIGGAMFQPSMQTAGQYTLDGAPIQFPTNGAVDSASLLMISGDWSQLVYAIRQDITYKVLTEAVIQDNTGAIVYNLPQQDMVALRAVIRLGFALPNPINRMQAVEASRFPFAALVPQ